MVIPFAVPDSTQFCFFVQTIEFSFEEAAVFLVYEAGWNHFKKLHMHVVYFVIHFHNIFITWLSIFFKLAACLSYTVKFLTSFAWVLSYDYKHNPNPVQLFNLNDFKIYILQLLILNKSLSSYAIWTSSRFFFSLKDYHFELWYYNTN